MSKVKSSSRQNDLALYRSLFHPHQCWLEINIQSFMTTWDKYEGQPTEWNCVFWTSRPMLVYDSVHIYSRPGTQQFSCTSVIFCQQGGSCQLNYDWLNFQLKKQNVFISPTVNKSIIWKEQTGTSNQNYQHKTCSNIFHMMWVMEAALSSTRQTNAGK